MNEPIEITPEVETALSWAAYRLGEIFPGASERAVDGFRSVEEGLVLKMNWSVRDTCGSYETREIDAFLPWHTLMNGDIELWADNVEEAGERRHEERERVKAEEAAERQRRRDEENRLRTEARETEIYLRVKARIEGGNNAGTV